jgi:hypothetical protein
VRRHVWSAALPETEIIASGVRPRVLTAARFALLAGPTALAFFSGGYFDLPRAWAGLVAWGLVAIALLAGAALPRARAALLALAGLGLLAAWTLVSYTWAPIAGSAFHAGERVVLYAGSLLAAALLLQSRRALRAVEPMLAAGALVVIGYGISERLIPGLLHFQRSVSAQGRLEQPLTYWNAMGELAAIGLVLCARLAGDTERGRPIRIAGAAAAAPLGMGLYLTFSRGALFACVAGLLVLLVAVPTREQLWGIAIAVGAGILAAAAAAPFHGVTALGGGLATRERQGAVALVLLVAVTLGAALAASAACRRATHARPLRMPGHAGWIALALICAGFGVAVAVGAKESSASPLSSGATRYETLESNRYDYWRVALRAFGDQPLRGVGAGGWAVYWLRLRSVDEFAQDAHSLPLQTAAELGLVGVGLLAAFLAGVALSARDAHRAAASLAAGPIAGFVVWVAHAPLDWDWQMPAVTLAALVLAGALITLAEPEFAAAPVPGRG